VPRFEPFPGVRYDPERVALHEVVAPPYDVIGPEERARLAARSPYNAVHVDLPVPDDGGDRYQAARRRFDQWLATGVLLTDSEPGFYVYRMGWHDESGKPGQTTGIIGALGLEAAGEGGVLPHERTMGRPKDDRLSLMRACRADLSPIWGLSLAPGLAQLSEVAGPPLARCTDDDGVHHRLWRLTQPGLLAAVSETVASAPVVIADGHHRYETALAHRDERRAATGGAPGDYDLVLAYLVELAPDQLSVGPIHRLLSGLPPDFDPLPALMTDFEVDDGGPPDAGLPGRMAGAGAMGLVARGHAWLLRPRPSMTGSDNGAEPDAGLLERAVGTWPPHATTYPHRVDDVLAGVATGDAQVGVLLRPPTVDQIAAAAREGRRMPQKSTFFRPKPRTGLLFRRLAD
jgi:uncharacterized protein (DUF1015 family)